MIDLNLYESVPRGNLLIGNVTALLRPTWRRSIRGLGGCWLGTAQISGERTDLDDWFQDGLLRELRETFLGDETWRGAIVRMEYTRGGDVFVRDATLIVNAVRARYTRSGDNLLTNGSGESGAWAAYNGPTAVTVAQDATWKTHGAYSIKITVTDTTIRGARVQSTISVTAGFEYKIHAAFKVTSGSWRFSANRADTDASLASGSTRGKTGDIVIDMTIEATNTYTGNVDLRITSEASAGIINADGCTFLESPYPAETGWITDDESIEWFGRHEEILALQTMTAADANGACTGRLLEAAWPLAMPPRSGQMIAQPGADSIIITVAGYWAALNWVYSSLGGTLTKNAWVKALGALQAEFVTVGAVEANSTDYVVDESSGPQRVGDVLKALVPGDVKYALGVEDRGRLNYTIVTEDLSYIRKNGQLYSVTGDEIDPPLAKPGWALWADLPDGPVWLTSHAQHDPRWTYLEEVELLPPTEAYPDGSVAFSLDAG
jgi:hypothetical protein